MITPRAKWLLAAVLWLSLWPFPVQSQSAAFTDAYNQFFGLACDSLKSRLHNLDVAHSKYEAYAYGKLLRNPSVARMDGINRRDRLNKIAAKFELVKDANFVFPRFTTAGPVTCHFHEKGYEVTTSIGPDLFEGARAAALLVALNRYDHVTTLNSKIAARSRTGCPASTCATTRLHRFKEYGRAPRAGLLPQAAY